MNPPESYIQEVLDSGFTYDQEVADTINVDDHQELQHMREWCTHVPNKQDRTFEEECLKICTQLGHYLCNSVPEKIEPTNDCKGNEDECRCCCKPSCNESRRRPWNCTAEETTESPVTENMPITEDCATDGFAAGYDNDENDDSAYDFEPRARPSDYMHCFFLFSIKKICSFLVVMSNSNWRENPSVEEESSK